jgi:hypothetical protein
MEHSDAIRLRAAERYVLGELSSQLRDEYEEHYFACQECAMELKATVAFVDGSRIALCAGNLVASRKPSAVPAVGGWFRWLRPAFALPAFVALLLFVGYQNILTIPGLRQAASRAGTAKVVKSFSLLGAGARGEASLTVSVHPDEDFGLDFDIPPGNSTAGYACQIQDEAGRSKVSPLHVSGEEANRTVHVNIPGGSLPPARYNLVISSDRALNTRTGRPDEVARLSFVVEFLP